MSTAKRSFFLLVLLPGLLIPLSVGILFSLPYKIPFEEAHVRMLPLVHAIINGSTAVLLLGALLAIKQRKILWHKRLIYVCIALGLLFLLSYVIYHASVPSTKYGDSNQDGVLSLTELNTVGVWRNIYLFVLISHIILATCVVFLVLIALYYARIEAFDKHRAVVRYAFPTWWYVSCSGVLVYLMLRPYYPEI